MQTVTMSFKAPIDFKDAIEFVAEYQNSSATKVILDWLQEYLEAKKQEIISEQYALKRSEEILEKYKNDGKFYTINDL